jgi:Tol biopolymer transport system component
LDDLPGGATEGPDRLRAADRLDSWKKIASYLKRDVSTVQRWERREGMPVHRHRHDKLGSIFAFRSELDAWWDSRRGRLAAAAVDEAAQPVPGAAATAVGEPERPPPPRARTARHGAMALAAAAVLLVAGLAWLATDSGYFWRNPLASAHYTRLSNAAGNVRAAAISRDGRLVAYLSDRDGKTDAWIAELGTDTHRNLTRDAALELVNPSIRTLGFSPDSSQVLLWSRRPDGSQPGDVNVLAVPASGGTPQRYLPGAAEIDWSHDGKRLVYHTTAPGDPLFVREPGAGADRQIYVAPNGAHCHFPVWSADDAYIYFVLGVPPDDWDLWRIRPSGVGLERITSQYARISYPVMLGPRKVLYLATDPDGSGPWVYATHIEQRRPHRVSSGLETYTSLAGTANGSRLIATIANPRASIWRLTLPRDRSAATAVSPPVQLVAEGRAPRLAGDHLLYVSSRGDRHGVWSMDHGSTRELWSLEHLHVAGGPAIAPDGRHVAVSVAGGDEHLLYVMNDDGSQARVLARGLVLRGDPAWAPDGQSVLSAVVRDGEPRLMRIFLNGDPPQLLVSEYSTDPVWSPDGRFLIYSGADVGTTFPLRAAAADGRPYPLASVMLTRGARRLAFFRGAQALLVLGGEIDHKNFSIIDLRTGERQVLAELPADFVIRDFDISADGSEITFERVEQRSTLALIDGADGSKR